MTGCIVTVASGWTYAVRLVSGRPGVDVAIVLVDTDEHPVWPSTLQSALDAAVPVTGEIVVVDARTTLGRAWVADDRVRVVGADPFIGGTGLRMRGMAATSAPFVAFLDAGATATPAWIATSLEALHADAGIGAVSGASAGVGEPTLSITGNVGAHHRLDHRMRHTVLFPMPEAAVVRRSAAQAVGGFLDELSWPCAVVDLGWRLTLAGRPVVVDPAAEVAAICTCAPDGYSGLVVLHSNLGDELLEAALPAALLVAAERDGATSGSATSIDRFVAASSRLAWRRAEVQATRRVDDPVVADLFVTALEPARGDEHLREVYRSAVGRHGLGEVLPSRRRVLIVTPDILATRMAGPAIRVWQIANALASRHDVHLASTAAKCELSSSLFALSAPDDRELQQLAADADVIILQGFAMEGRAYFKHPDNILIVDIYDPLHLEQLELFKDATEAHRRVTVLGATRVLNEQLVRGDFFVCASAKQRDFWLGQLAGLGRVNHVSYGDDNRLHRLLDVVPFGLPDDPPVATAPAIRGVVPGIGLEDEVILWGGGIYNWFDPLTLIRAVDRLKERRPSVRLYFMGLRHPNPDVTEMRIATEARRLAKELRLTDRHVFFNEGWVPYEERQNYLLDADIGVSTHFDHLETEFSFRTRILDYIWAALPIVATDGDGFADLVVKENLGLVVPAVDVAALEAALDRLLSDAEFSRACRAQLERLRPQFAWSRVLEPIVSFCRRPRRAPDLLDAELRRHLWATDAERQEEWLRSQPKTSERLRRLLATM